MNGRTAKRLRREARAATKGLPERGYRLNLAKGTVTVMTDTTRGHYKALKRQHKRGVKA